MISQVITIRLKELLEEKGMTLYRLARESGLAYQALAKIRDHKVTDIKLGTLDRLCGVLKCEPNDLLVYKPFMVAAPGHEQPTD